MADTTRANTAEVRYGVSHVVLGTYHISLFVDKYNDQGKLEERIEVRAEPEHRTDDYGTTGFWQNGHDFGTIKATVSKVEASADIEKFGDFYTDPSHVIKEGLSHTQAKKIIQEFTRESEIITNANIRYTIGEFEDEPTGYREINAKFMQNSNTVARYLSQKVLEQDLPRIPEITPGSGWGNVTFLRDKIRLQQITEWTPQKEQIASTVESIIKFTEGTFIEVYNALANFFRAESSPRSPTATIVTKTNPLTKDVNLKKTKTTKETNDPEDSGGDGGGDSPESPKIFDGWFVNFQNNPPIRRPAPPPEPVATPEPDDRGPTPVISVVTPPKPRPKPPEPPDRGPSSTITLPTPRPKPKKEEAPEDHYHDNDGDPPGGDSYTGDPAYGHRDGRPVVFDINQDDRIEHIAAQHSTVMWDFDGDGFAARTSWIGSNDGFLVYDKDNDNHVTATDEVSFISYVRGAKTDLEGLKHFDSNNDDRLSRADREWSRFKIWVDANQNGRTDAGEVRTLASHTITAIDLSVRKAVKKDNGNTIFQDVVVSLSGGKTMLGHDVRFATIGDSMRLEVYADGLYLKSKADDGSIRAILIGQKDSGIKVDVNEYKWLSAFAATAFADTVTHSGSSDMIIHGLDGSDRLTGGSGADVLDGGTGNDTLTGGFGGDTLIGGSGHDILYGGQGISGWDSGKNLLIGGSGNDHLTGGNHDDMLFGGMGIDVLKGGTGNDTLDGGTGNDDLRGGYGDDVLRGDEGEDRLVGDSQNDVLYGGKGDDILLGRSGNDILNGGAGRDQLTGGLGQDVFVLYQGQRKTGVSQRDVVVDFAKGRDRIWVDVGDRADTTLAALMTAAKLRISYADITTGTSTNSGTIKDAVISATQDTLSTRDDVVLMVIEDTVNLTRDDFVQTKAHPISVKLRELDGVTGTRFDGESTGDQAGFSVSHAGDINADGFGDIIISAPYANPNGNNSGSTYVVFGKKGGFAASMKMSAVNGINGFRLDGEEAWDYSGYSVSGAGDINADGFDDIIISTPYADPNGYSSGSTYIVFGKKGGFAVSMNLSTVDGINGFRLDGNEARHYSGQSVAAAGDINADGFADIIIGARGADYHDGESGSAYVVFGKQGGFPASMNMSAVNGINGFRLDGEKVGDRAGFSVSGAGDINADGFDDLIVGSPHADHRGNSSGSAYVVFGKKYGFVDLMHLSTVNGTNGFRLDGEKANAQAGYSVSGAGDINADGFDDIVIGTYHDDARGHYSRTTYVLFGKNDGFAANMNLSAVDGRNGFSISDDNDLYSTGHFVSAAGDVNGDGFGDIVIVTNQVNPEGIKTGVAFVVFGKATGFEAHMKLSELKKANSIRLDDTEPFGWPAVSGAGDMNGDGYDDIVIGSSATDHGDINNGSAYIYYSFAAKVLTIGKPDVGNTIVLDDAPSHEHHVEWRRHNEDGTIAQVGTGESYIVTSDDIDAKLSATVIYTNLNYDLVTVRSDLVVATSDGIETERTSDSKGKYQRLNGNTEDNYLSGGIGNDTIYGYAGNDRIYGGSGNDLLVGGSGEDTLAGDVGRDILRGGSGSDLFVFDPVLPDFDIIQDFSFKKMSGKQSFHGTTRGGNDALLINITDADVMTINYESTNATKLATLMDLARLRWTNDSNHDSDSKTNDATIHDTIIYNTQATPSTSDDMVVAVLEDFTLDLTWNMFEVV